METHTLINGVEAAVTLAGIALWVVRRYKARPRFLDLLALLLFMGGLIGLVWWTGQFSSPRQR